MLGVELIAISELLLLALGPTHYEVTVGGGEEEGREGGGVQLTVSDHVWEEFMHKCAHTHGCVKNNFLCK